MAQTVGAHGNLYLYSAVHQAELQTPAVGLVCVLLPEQMLFGHSPQDFIMNLDSLNWWSDPRSVTEMGTLRGPTTD